MTDPAATLPPRYRVERVVGEGGFGVVLRAHDQDLDRPVAIKRLRAGDAEARARFLREAQRTAALRHPHVIEVLDYGEDATGAPFLVYEWVDGHDLAAVLAAGERPPAPTVRAWGAAIAEALHAAHQAGVVHRDVKPANVLRRTDGHVLLADLGIARVVGGRTVQTAEGLLLGTPAFMAPELWRGEPAGPASDQWAWAASLDLLAGGPLPWRSEEVPAILAAARHPRPVQAAGPRLDAGLRATLTRALDPDPARRFPDMAAMAAALRAEAEAEAEAGAVSPASVPAPPTVRLGTAAPAPPTPHPRTQPAPPTPRPGLAPRPDRARLGALAGTALLGVGLAVGLAWRSPGGPAAPPPARAPGLEDPTSAALAQEGSRFLAAHLDADDHYRSGPPHREEFQAVWGRDPRAPLAARRWVLAARAWLEARPGAWQTADPDGPSRALYREIRERVTRPLHHLLDDMQQLRGDQDVGQATFDQLMGRPPPARPLARPNDQEMLEFLEVEFRRRLGPPERGVARLELEAYLLAGAMPGDFPKGFAPQDAGTTRSDTLRRLAAALEGPLGPLAKLRLTRAAQALALDLRYREVIAGEFWDHLLDLFAASLDLEPAPGIHDPAVTLATKRAIAGAVLQGLVKGSRILQRPATPAAWEAARRAVTWIGAHPDGDPAAHLADLREWIRERDVYLAESDAGDTAELLRALGDLEAAGR